MFVTAESAKAKPENKEKEREKSSIPGFRIAYLTEVLFNSMIILLFEYLFHVQLNLVEFNLVEFFDCIH